MNGEQNGQGSPAGRAASTPVSKPPWWRPWVAPGVILIAVGLGWALIDALFDIHGEIARVETDLGKQVHKESKEIRELVGQNAAEVKGLKGELSGLKREVSGVRVRIESMDRKLDKALEKVRDTGAVPINSPAQHTENRP